MSYFIYPYMCLIEGMSQECLVVVGQIMVSRLPFKVLDVASEKHRCMVCTSLMA